MRLLGRDTCYRCQKPATHEIRWWKYETVDLACIDHAVKADGWATLVRI